MRIAVVTSSYPNHAEDPAGHFVAAEVRSLIEAGHEVTVFAPSAPSPRPLTAAKVVELPHWGLFGWPGALTRLNRRPWRVFGLVPFVQRARRRMRTERPFDRVLTHWIVPGFWPICRDFGRETVVVAHGSDVRMLERLPSPLRRAILADLGRDNVSLRCVSTDLAARLERLRAAHGTNALRITIEQAPIEVPPLAPRSELRRQLGLSATPIVVIVGRAVKSKRIDLAIEVARQASALAALPVQPNIVVIGDGPQRLEWMQRFPEVHWLGQLGRSDALKYIRAADLLVSASLHEGAPTVVREARILGTEVLAANAGDLVQWSARDEGLLVVDDFSADPLGAACTQVARALQRAAAQCAANRPASRPLALGKAPDVTSVDVDEVATRRAALHRAKTVY